MPQRLSMSSRLTDAFLHPDAFPHRPMQNSRRPVRPSRCSGQAHTRHHRSPEGENRRPVQLGVSVQCVACPCRSWIILQHLMGSEMKALA